MSAIKQQTKLLAHQPHQDEPPQYLSNSMSVLPADRYGSYYIIYHQDVNGDCIDAETASLTNNDSNRNRRADCGIEQIDVTSGHIRPAPKSNGKFTVTGTCLPAICMQEQDDEDEYDYYDDDGCASHVTEIFVASSIPVLHFIQYFLC